MRRSTRSDVAREGSAGVRSLGLDDLAPKAEIVINGPAYDLGDYIFGARVLDIGCGRGKNRRDIEEAGGTWIGVEPFPGGAHNLIADGQCLPFPTASFDVIIMDSVLEHVPDVDLAFSEISRVLRSGGVFLGYAAFMECFHEISYSHLSFKALERYSERNGMELVRIAGGSRFGIDYHLAVLLRPLPVRRLRESVAFGIRSVLKLKAKAGYLALRFRQRRPKSEAHRLSELYFQIECLRQSNGYSFVITRVNSAPGVEAHESVHADLSNA